MSRFPNGFKQLDTPLIWKGKFSSMHCSIIRILDDSLPNEEKTHKTFPANISNYDSMF